MTKSDNLENVAALFGTLGFLGSAGIWCYQIYSYVKSGWWLSLSAADALYKLTCIEWFAFPDCWRGLHFWLAKFNSGFLVLFAGMSVALVFMEVSALLEYPAKSNE